MKLLHTLQEAVDLVTKAVEEDYNHNYEEALLLYERGIECFVYASTYEIKSERFREKVRMKCLLYVDRANKIKEYLEKERKKKAVKRKDGMSGSDSSDPKKQKLQGKPCCWKCS